ncbi:MAG: hypothetical protein ACSHXB_19780 [Sulfitobacter sp.]
MRIEQTCSFGLVSMPAVGMTKIEQALYFLKDWLRAKQLFDRAAIVGMNGFPQTGTRHPDFANCFDRSPAA